MKVYFTHSPPSGSMTSALVQLIMCRLPEWIYQVARRLFIACSTCVCAVKIIFVLLLVRTYVLQVAVWIMRVIP